MAKSQITLFGKEAEEQEKDKKERTPIEDIVKYDTEQEKRIDNFAKECKKKKENYSYLRIWTAVRTSLIKREEKFIFENVTERPFRADWDSYGGQWGSLPSVNRKDTKKVKERIIEFFRSELSTPYIKPEEKKDLKEHWLRDINDNSIKVFYSAQARTWLGKDNLKEIESEVDKLKGNTATEEQKEVAVKERKIDDKIEETNKNIIEYEKTVKQMKKEGKDYDKIMPYMKQVYIGRRKVNELKSEHDDICEKMRKIIRGEKIG